MDTTTPDSGAPAQPQETEADSTGYNADQVIVNDENGVPDLAPVATQQDQPNDDQAGEEPEPQAPTSSETDAEVVAWAEKKGLNINPENPNEVKLARVNLENDRRFHESQQQKSVIQPPEQLEETGDPNYDAIVESQNRTQMQMYVRDWFDANPGMKDARTDLMKIAQERPWLTNMDDVRAHYLADPNRATQLKQDGGREALTNLAQKQAQVPPAAGATNSGVYDSQTITPQNVYALVDSHDQEWFEKNHSAISKAMSGK